MFLSFSFPFMIKYYNILQHNINQSETAIGDKNLSVELYARSPLGKSQPREFRGHRSCSIEDTIYLPRDLGRPRDQRIM